MYYAAIDRWSSPYSYLEHHGVKGQKWGHRKARYIVDGARHKVGQALYNRGKKLSGGVYKEGGRYKTFIPGITPGFRIARGLATGHTAKIVGNTAKSFYDIERNRALRPTANKLLTDGIHKGVAKPSTFTVGLAATSVVLSAYGAVQISNAIGDSVAYEYYKKNRRNPEYNPKYRKKK